jgi:3-phosphoshikimate 1-carboxyvinyltransferase
MKVSGGKPKAATINSNNDHRIAMMGGILATLTDEPIRIEDPQAINKSYPRFFMDLEKISNE